MSGPGTEFIKRHTRPHYTQLIVRGSIYVGVAMATEMRESLHNLVSHGTALSFNDWINVCVGMVIIGLNTLGSFLDQTFSKHQASITQPPQAPPVAGLAALMLLIALFWNMASGSESAPARREDGSQQIVACWFRDQRLERAAGILSASAPSFGATAPKRSEGGPADQ